MLTRRRFVQLGPVFLAGSSRFGLAGDSALPGIRRTTFTMGELPPSWNGVRILQISDVHAGSYMSVERMRRIRDLAASVPADLVVLTGDQIDRRRGDAELFTRGFSGLAAPLGVYGILGNHDHYIDPDVSERALHRAGITPLVNDSVELVRNGQGLAIVGLEDIQASIGRGPDFNVLQRHPNAFRICLCHQPQGWPDALAAGAHLTLSGHTHGGQIALNTRTLNLARLHTRFIAGPYRRDDGFLYVSRGIGVGAVPLRVGAPPELDLITLRRAAVAAAA